ncbi:MAG: hypothetical protein MSH25_03720, partial [Desulfovibrio sp.]|uniref:hypothetical protein n=1 Tax=Desulfovibrio sp. TaxID=885 RepID=UPI0025BCC257
MTEEVEHQLMPEHFNPLRDKMLYGGPRDAGEIRFYELRLLARDLVSVKLFLFAAVPGAFSVFRAFHL